MMVRKYFKGGIKVKRKIKDEIFEMLMEDGSVDGYIDISEFGEVEGKSLLIGGLTLEKGKIKSFTIVTISEHFTDHEEYSYDYTKYLGEVVFEDEESTLIFEYDKERGYYSILDM